MSTNTCFCAILFILYIRPTKQDTSYPIILPGFKGVATSSSLELANDRQIYVRNLRISPKPDKYEFRAAKRGQLGEKVKYKIHQKYPFVGQDVTIEFYNGSKISDFYSLGIWTETDGFIAEAKLLQKKKSEKIVYEYIPCRNIEQEEDCRLNSLQSVQLKIYPGNDTILSDESYEDDDVLFKAQFAYGLVCEEIIEYDPDEFMLLSNGDLWVRDVSSNSLLSEKFTKRHYCLTSVCKEVSDKPVRMVTAFICAESNNLHQIFLKVKKTFLVLSAIAATLTCALFIVLSTEDTVFPKILVIGYAITISAFLFVWSIALFMSFDNSTCSTFVFLYQYFSVTSFTIISLLIIETYYLVRNIHESHYEARFTYYLISAIGFPLFMVILSMAFPIRSLVTAQNESCLMTSQRTIFLYFVPIVLLIVISIVFVGLTSNNIKTADGIMHIFWRTIRKDVKNLHRGCVVLLILMIVSWCAELIAYFVGPTTGMLESLNVIASLQGLFTFIVFVLHNPLYGILKFHFNKYFNAPDESANESAEPFRP